MPETLTRHVTPRPFRAGRLCLALRRWVGAGAPTGEWVDPLDEPLDSPSTDDIAVPEWDERDVVLV